MLQQKPSDRPTCSQILEMPEVIRHIPESLRAKTCIDASEHLLGTIRLPVGNLNRISEKLPKANYEGTPSNSNSKLQRVSSLPSCGLFQFGTPKLKDGSIITKKEHEETKQLLD